MGLGVGRLVIDVVGRQAQGAVTVDVTALTLNGHGVDRQRACARMLDSSLGIDQRARGQAQVVAVDRDAAPGVIQGSVRRGELDGEIRTAGLHQLAGHVG